MQNYKKTISDNICYTKLVYNRINKKLDWELSEAEIEVMVSKIIHETDESAFQKIGKNIYISNIQRNTKLTINSFTNRIITADKLNKTLPTPC
jgi:hypothetical protein